MSTNVGAQALLCRVRGGRGQSDRSLWELQSGIESVGEAADLKAVYDTERQLLHVARTRAPDCLWVSGVEPASEFLEVVEANGDSEFGRKVAGDRG